MKKLLILAYDFPPYVSVGGLRPYNWFRYLKEFGVEPIVVTRQWGNAHGNHLDYIEAGSSDNVLVEKSEFGTILRTPYGPNLSNRLLLKHGESKYRLLRKSISGFYEFAQFLYPVGPKSEIYSAARDYLKENKVDAIVASGDPFILFKYASELSSDFNIPWIADYRDPWSKGIHIQNNSLLKLFASFQEKRIVKSARVITTANQFFKELLLESFPEKEINILSNGYSDYALEKIEKEKTKNSELNIAFAGTIYNWHPIFEVLKVLEIYITENNRNRIQLNFYGINKESELKDFLETECTNLLNNVSFFKKINNDKLAPLLSKNDLFLLFNDYSIIGTKIYTYLGLKKSILFCFENDENANKIKDLYFKLKPNNKSYQADLIKETNSGIIVQDATHLKCVLEDLYAEFKEKGFIACDSVGVEKYSRKIQVEKLAEIVKSI